MKKYVTLSVIIICLAVISIHVPPLNSSGSHGRWKVELPDNQSDDVYNIYETVFRYMFQNNGSCIKQNAKAYFLKIGDKDPSKEFLERFKTNVPSVYEGSKFAVGQGLLFVILSIKRVDANTVDVGVEWLEGKVGAASGNYLVVRIEGKWKVEGIMPNSGGIIA